MEPRHEKPGFLRYAKTKTQISFAVTSKLISTFAFVTRIVQSFYFLNPKFQASSHFLWLYRPVCVGPGRKLRRPVFSERGSMKVKDSLHIVHQVNYSNNKAKTIKNTKQLFTKTAEVRRIPCKQHLSCINPDAGSN